MDGGDLQRLTHVFVLGLDGDVVSQIGEDGASLFGSEWSPDGEWIAFSLTTSGFRADVFISRPNGDERMQIADSRRLRPS